MNGGDAADVPDRPLPFLRRYDPDQVQGSGSPPSQHRQVRPSATEEARGAREVMSTIGDQHCITVFPTTSAAATSMVSGAAAKSLQCDTKTVQRESRSRRCL